jgi:non-heme chloroperoxidase
MNRITTADDISLDLKVWSSGRLVVLIRRWPLSADSWDDQTMALSAAGHQTIADDRREIGRSSQPWSGYDYDNPADETLLEYDRAPHGLFATENMRLNEDLLKYLAR